MFPFQPRRLFSLKKPAIFQLILSVFCVYSLVCCIPLPTPVLPAEEIQSSLKRFEFAQPIMGTTARMVIYAPNSGQASSASKIVFDRLEALESMMSDYSPESELNRLCQSAGGPSVAVSFNLFDVLEKSQALARQTKGAFDITVGPVVQLWRRTRRRTETPNSERLAEARKLVGYEKLSLDTVNHTARLSIAGMKLDLGGIAKGYAADEAIKVLKSNGIEQALVAIGGDIALGAPPPGKSGWQVEINAGAVFKKKPHQHLVLNHAGVSTSGDAEQYVEISGKRYSHIIDPRNGIALTGYRSVTIVAANATQSDSLATALCVLGPKAGLQFIQTQPSTAALYLEIVGGKVREYQSRLWKGYSSKH